MWLRILRWGEFPRLSGWTQCIQDIPYKNARGVRVRGKCDVTMEAEIRVMLFEEGSGQNPRATATRTLKGKGMDSAPLRVLRRNQHSCQHLDCSSVKSISDF